MHALPLALPGLLVPTLLTTLLASSAAAASSLPSSSPLSVPAAANNSFWYDWGLYGAYPRRSYESFAWASPWVNLVQTSPRCDADAAYTFIEPRGDAVPHPGPVALDNKGNLVWMEPKWGQAMDVKVQSYRGRDYITFWHGGDSGWFGRGSYLMLDDAYRVFRNVTAAGDLDGDLHEFQLTDEGTALLTAYDTRPADLTAYGVPDGRIIDSLFQEVDLETGALLFEWRASDHYPVTESLAPYESYHGAWDFFHINSVQKEPTTGHYLVSSRYMCAVAAVNATSGAVVWQVGGRNNSFADQSDGAATSFSWQHHTRLVDNGTLLTVFDNGAYYDKPLRRAAHSRALLVDLDTGPAMTATLRRELVSPAGFLSPSQGSVNILPATGNVLVGWGHTPAWTEYDAVTGEVLCDTHLGATSLDFLGWCKNYRTFKSPWVGRPDTPPDAVLKTTGVRGGRQKRVLYVSWNGATEVERWVVRTAWASDGGDDDDEDDDPFASVTNVTSARKQGFETRIDLGSSVGGGEEDALLGAYVQAQAYDRDGLLLGASEWIDTKTGLYHGKSAAALPVPEKMGIPKTQCIMTAIVLGVVGGTTLLVLLRGLLWKGACLAVAKARASWAARGQWHRYNVLPQVEASEARDGGSRTGKDAATVGEDPRE